MQARKDWEEYKAGSPAGAEQEIKLTRDRVEAAIRKAVDQMAKYRGDTMIPVSDFLDDALQYALDEAVKSDSVLKAEDALLEEVKALRASSSAPAAGALSQFRGEAP